MVPKCLKIILDERWRTQHCEGVGFGFTELTYCQSSVDSSKDTSSPAILSHALVVSSEVDTTACHAVPCLYLAPLGWELLVLDLTWADAMTKRLRCWPPLTHLHSDPWQNASGGGRLSTAGAGATPAAVLPSAVSMSSTRFRRASVWLSPRPSHLGQHGVPP